MEGIFLIKGMEEYYDSMTDTYNWDILQWGSSDVLIAKRGERAKRIESNK